MQNKTPKSNVDTIKAEMRSKEFESFFCVTKKSKYRWSDNMKCKITFQYQYTIIYTTEFELRCEKF